MPYEKRKILERTSHQVEFHSFPLYLLIVVYGILLYLLCALLFPDGLKEYEGFEGYFYLRKQWFFGLLAAAWAIDYVDTCPRDEVPLESPKWLTNPEPPESS